MRTVVTSMGSRPVRSVREHLLCIVACVAVVVSTALYGAAVLLFARILWGLAYAVLVLVTGMVLVSAAASWPGVG